MYSAALHSFRSTQRTHVTTPEGQCRLLPRTPPAGRTCCRNFLISANCACSLPAMRSRTRSISSCGCEGKRRAAGVWGATQAPWATTGETNNVRRHAAARRAGPGFSFRHGVTKGSGRPCSHPTDNRHTCHKQYSSSGSSNAPCAASGAPRTAAQWPAPAPAAPPSCGSGPPAARWQGTTPRSQANVPLDCTMHHG